MQHSNQLPEKKVFPQRTPKPNYQLGDVVINEQEKVMGEVLASTNKWVKIRVLNKKLPDGQPVIRRYAFKHVRLFMTIAQRIELINKVEARNKTANAPGFMARIGNAIKKLVQPKALEKEAK